MSAKNFLQSPQNRTGLAIWLGTAITVLIQWGVLHQQLPAVDILGLVVGFLKIIEPETSVTTAQLEQAVSDVKMLLQSGDVTKVAAVASDVGALAHEILK